MYPPASAVAASAVRHRERVAAAELARRMESLPTAGRTAATACAAWLRAMGAAIRRTRGNVQGRHGGRVGGTAAVAEGDLGSAR
jgi:hypothetical protein